MPLYEYHCECNNEKEVKLSFQDADLPQVCECGKVMRKKMSISSFVMKPTGRGMALDSLNSKSGGFPNGRRKAEMQQAVANGL